MEEQKIKAEDVIKTAQVLLEKFKLDNYDFGKEYLEFYNACVKIKTKTKYYKNERYKLIILLNKMEDEEVKNLISKVIHSDEILDEMYGLATQSNLTTTV